MYRTLYPARSGRIWSVAASAGLLAAFAIPITAASAPPHTRIELGKGIGGVNIGYQRGTVERFLGFPQQVVSELGQKAGPGNLYLANYRDEGLSVYYNLKNRAGRSDRARDRFDRVAGVVTFSRRYTGTLAPGKGYTGSDCLPADRRGAPGGGPRRVAFCMHGRDDSTPGVAILYMSVSSPTRAGQRISGVGVFNALLGGIIWRGLIEEVLEGLDCKNLETCN